METDRRPTREEVAAAAGRTIPDVLRRGLDLVFCGINPGLYSGATGHHFARPGNRFWTSLHGAGFTDRLLSPFEDALLPEYGLGVTNLVSRATASAAELTAEELRRRDLHGQAPAVPAPDHRGRQRDRLPGGVRSARRRRGASA